MWLVSLLLQHPWQEAWCPGLLGEPGHPVQPEELGHLVLLLLPLQLAWLVAWLTLDQSPSDQLAGRLHLFLLVPGLQASLHLLPFLVVALREWVLFVVPSESDQ